MTKKPPCVLSRSQYGALPYTRIQTSLPDEVCVLTAVLLKIQDFWDGWPSLVFLDGLILKMKTLRSLEMSVTTQ